MKQEITIKDMFNLKIKDYILMIAIRNLEKIRKNNLYYIKYINDSQIFIYNYVCNFNDINKCFPIYICKKEELNNIFVNINSSIYINVKYKELFKKNNKIYSFSFINNEIFKNMINMNLQKIENIKFKPHSINFRDEVNQYKLDNLFLQEQIPKLYYYILTNIYLIFKDIEINILEEFLDSILNIIKEMENICLKNKYFYPYYETTNESKLLNDFRLYTENLYNFLISFQEVNKTTKINICKESRKDFFLKLSKPKFLNSNIKKDLDPHIDDILMENEKELIQILKFKNEFLKEISK